jgi:hypothetical protein
MNDGREVIMESVDASRSPDLVCFFAFAASKSISNIPTGLRMLKEEPWPLIQASGSTNFKLQ